MGNTTIKKVQLDYASKRGPERLMVSGRSVALRLWDNEMPGEQKETTSRDYETVGFVLEGRAEVLSEGQRIVLEKGDSWLIPAGAVHTYNILEPFTAVEATSPPARMPG